jgi:hypothetical protein
MYETAFGSESGAQVGSILEKRPDQLFPSF